MDGLFALGRELGMLSAGKLHPEQWELENYGSAKD
jgi:hypothetical protein